MLKCLNPRIHPVVEVPVVWIFLSFFPFGALQISSQGYHSVEEVFAEFAHKEVDHPLGNERNFGVYLANELHEKLGPGPDLDLKTELLQVVLHAFGVEVNLYLVLVQIILVLVNGFGQNHDGFIEIKSVVANATDKTLPIRNKGGTVMKVHNFVAFMNFFNLFNKLIPFYSPCKRAGSPCIDRTRRRY